MNKPPLLQSLAFDSILGNVKLIAEAWDAVVSTPTEDESVDDETKIRDINDCSILRAAVKFGVDILITGGLSGFY